jgi:hypothetical protein
MGQNDMIFVSQDGNFKEEHNEKLLDLWVEQTRHSPTRISKHIANLKKTAQKTPIIPIQFVYITWWCNSTNFYGLCFISVEGAHIPTYGG